MLAAMTDRRELDRRVNEQLDREERERIAYELDESSPRDYLLGLGMAALGSLPVAGPLLTSVLNERIPRRRWERMVEFGRKLETAVGRVEVRLDREFVQTDEVADLVEEVLERTSRRDADGKRAYYAAALANSLTTNRPDMEERERMLDVLDQLRPAHLRLLAGVARTHGMPDGIPATTSMRIVVGALVDGVAEEQWLMDWADLERLGVFPQFPGGMMTEHGTENIAGRITPFGKRFVEWIGADVEGNEEKT
jgi:hypothetical protein